MLRKQIPEEFATWEDPILGINLFDAQEDLKPGEAITMQNCVYRGGIAMRRGSTRITSTLMANRRVRGGHKYYFGGTLPGKERLVAFNTRISKITDGGVETILYDLQTTDLNTYFTTWTITDKVYISNGTDPLLFYDGFTMAPLAGTNIPNPRARVAPILDRLFAITLNGIERTDPRDDSIWSNDSPWATFRPSEVGLFTALHSFTMRGTDTIYPGAFAFQANAYYLISGTDFGSDVTSLTASEGENGSIQLLNNTVGTSSPNSIVTVPGVGIFWFTTDLNVFWVPEGSLSGQYVGDKLRSNSSTIGIESVNKAALANVWMTHFDRYLVLGVPMGSSTWPTTQFWGDLYEITRADKTKPVSTVWYGPMTGQTVGVVWREDQQGELKLVGGEGNPDTGVFIYNLMEPGRYKDAVGLDDNEIDVVYQTYFKDFGAHSREKYIRSVNFDLRNVSGTPEMDLLDVDGSIIGGVPINVIL